MLMLVYSLFGVILLILLNFFIYKIENKTKKGVTFFWSLDLLKTMSEAIVIFLSVVLAIALTDWNDEKQKKNKIVNLFERSATELEAASEFNDLFIAMYDVGIVDLRFLQSNMAYSISTLEMVMHDSELIPLMSAASYCRISSHMEIIGDFVNDTELLDANSEEIYNNMKGINNSIDLIMQCIDNETKYLEGEYTYEELVNEYQENWDLGGEEISLSEFAEMYKEVMNDNLKEMVE